MYNSTHVRDRLRVARFKSVIARIEQGWLFYEVVDAKREDVTDRRLRDLRRRVASIERGLLAEHAVLDAERWLSQEARAEYLDLAATREELIARHVADLGPFARADVLHSEVHIIELSMFDLRLHHMDPGDGLEPQVVR